MKPVPSEHKGEVLPTGASPPAAGTDNARLDEGGKYEQHNL